MLRLLLLALLAATLGVSAPFPVMGQSDESCIAYMEADAAYRQAKIVASAKPDYRAAQEEAERAHRKWSEAYDKARRKEEKAFEIAFWEAKLKGIKMSKDAHKLLFPEDDVAENAAREVRDEATATVDALLAYYTLSADRRRGQAYRAAYQGPISSNPHVMAQLILADRERCRQRFE